MCSPHSQRRDRLDPGFSLVEMIVVIAIIGILVTVAVPALLTAVERSRQRRSMADMHELATANGRYRVDNGTYAADLTDLAPEQLGVVPLNDGWGNPFDYSLGGGGLAYTLTSYGRDGAPGPAAPSPWISDPFEPDIILQSGVFTQAPSGE